MQKIQAITLLSFVISSIQASVMVLEFKPEGYDTWHGEEVAAVACNENCPTFYTDSFATTNLGQEITDGIEAADIINMSFSVFKPSHPWFDSMGDRNAYQENLKKYEAALIEFETDKESLKDMIENNKDKLFVIASGNGVVMDIMSTPGVVVSERNELYPSLFNFDNTMKVASLKKTEVDFNNLETHSLASYSNYGLHTVDIAAPVELNRKGEEQKGTSFAAPFVSRMAEEVKMALPHFNANKIKELLMKSVYIPNLKKAIWASIDLRDKGSNSLVYKAQHERNYFKRIELQKQLEGIILVKSGGYLVPELVSSCINSIITLNLSIQDACLMAHADVFHGDAERLEELEKLWSLRSL